MSEFRAPPAEGIETDREGQIVAADYQGEEITLQLPTEQPSPFPVLPDLDEDDQPAPMGF